MMNDSFFVIVPSRIGPLVLIQKYYSSKSFLKSLLILGICVVSLSSPFVGGHEEDLKARNVLPPYNGSGYRRDAGGVQPFGPVGGTSNGVELLSWVTLPEMQAGISNGNDCWGHTSASGREYALMAHSSGTTVIEVTNPGNPVVIDTVAGPTSLWRDVKSFSTFAYSVSEGGSGIQVIDLTDVDNGVVSLAGTINDVGSAATHNVAIDEESGFLYRCGGGGNGLRIYSLADPGNPVFVGSWGERYVHDVQVKRILNTTTQIEREIAFACSGNNPAVLDIVDVTDKANPIVLSSTPYGGSQFSHQGWVSADNKFFYLGDELDENGSQGTKTYVFDVRVLGSPSLVTEYISDNPSVNHNMYTLGNRIFQANYRSGLRILDDTNPLNIIEVGFFDTVPEDDNADFSGLWSCYPYFPSGIVIGSDMQKGLYVWSIQPVPFAFGYPAGIPDLVNPAGDTLIVEINAQTGFSVDSSTPSLWVDNGAGFVSSSMVEISPGIFEGNFPPSTCGSEIRWYVSAAALTGEIQFDPPSSPAGFFAATSGSGLNTLVSEDMEIDNGWQVGLPSDDATTGVWTLGDPNGTVAQPEDDNSQVGSFCWFTGQAAAGSGAGTNDIDGGTTTLTSPVFDLSAATDPQISYFLWYSNTSGASPSQDVFRTEISSDGGVTWALLEEVGPSGPDTGGGWIQRQFNLSAFITLTSSVQVRFIASDLGSPSVVEAAIDDLVISDLDCNDCNGNGVNDATDIAAGTSADSNGDGIPDECQCTPFIRGELNDDGEVDISDAIQILLQLFNGSPSPQPVERADVNSSGSVDIADAVYLVQYLFQGGTPPGFPFPVADCN